MTAHVPEIVADTARGRTGKRVRLAEALVVLAVGLGSVVGVLTGPLLETPFTGLALTLGAIAAFLLAFRWTLLTERWFLALWVGASIAVAVVSALTGALNGLTDEPYATPAFVQLYPNLYGGTLHLTYSQYGGGPYSIAAAYVYLPLLPWIQVPGLDYRWVAVATWLIAVYLLRAKGAAVLLFGGPYVALVAANGFNDLVPIALLTVAFVPVSRGSSRAAGLVALGLKQFANVFVVLYCLWHRRWTELGVAVGVTVAFLVPFLLFDAGGVLCHAFLFDPGPGCTGGAGFTTVSSIMGHVNYFVWLLWGLGVFGSGYVATLQGPAYAEERAALVRARSASAARPGSGALSATDLMRLPLLRVRARLFRRERPSTAPR